MPKPTHLLLLLSLWLFPAAQLESALIAPPDQGTTESAKAQLATVTCQSCKGSGTREVACDLCKGEGEGSCHQCYPVIARRYERRLEVLLASLDPAIRARHESRAQAMRIAQKRLADDLAGVRIADRAGSLACPALCPKNPAVGGAAPLTAGSCKYCGSGSSCLSLPFVECPSCDGTYVDECGPCDGRGKRVAACPECTGAGVVPVHPLDQAQGCPWCRGKGVKECFACDDDCLADRECLTCLGRGDLVCLRCAGTSDAGCLTCFGSGKGPTGGASGAKPKSCSDCSGRGHHSCIDCIKGRTQCHSCEGAALARRTCAVCFGHKQALCGGCAQGSSLSWEVAADRLANAGQPRKAIDFLDVAIDRQKALRDQRLKSYDLKSAEGRALARKLERAVTLLRKRRKKWGRKAARDTGPADESRSK